MTVFFAWADPTETTFDPVAHARIDENVCSLKLRHEEGQIPAVEAVVRNPSQGLLNPANKQWLWISTDMRGSVEPVFFGRLIGIPTDLTGYLVTLQFLSRSVDYISQKQGLADTLRVFPYYDPIFLSAEAQIDPDAVLEGYSANYHVDRCPQYGREAMTWTISDILEGEDGTIVFSQDEIFYNSMSMDLKQSALRAVRVDATCHWRQWFRGQVVPVYVGVIRSLTGNHLAEQWPKPGTSLGGGWMAAWPSRALAIGGNTGSFTENGSWQDPNKDHAEGDVISASWSINKPLIHGITVNYQEEYTYANIGGHWSDSSGQSNTAGYSVSYNVIAEWKVYAQLFITPDNTPNEFTETFTFTLNADIQHILSDPAAQYETEVITLESQDVGEAAYYYRAWSSIKGQHVDVGMIVQPNIQVGPGGLSFQIVIQAGTLGTTAPLYSDFIGVTTTDGTAILACIGPSLPSIGDWKPNSYFYPGSIICVEDNGGYFYLATYGGVTGDENHFPFPYYMNFQSPEFGSNGIPPEFALGYTAGPGYGWFPPIYGQTFFPPSVGSTYGDNQVVWYCLGGGGPSLVTPINGGRPGNITADAFFTSQRGNVAIGNALMRARAKMRTRSRAVEISGQVALKQALDLNCRVSATLHSPLIPGGTATGKVIKYEFSLDGETGEFIAIVTIGCAIGNGGSGYVDIPGTGLYAEDGYFAPGYQQTTGSLKAFSDTGFTPPPPSLTTNGFTSPLTPGQVVMEAGQQGSVAIQSKLAVGNTRNFTGGKWLNAAQYRALGVQNNAELAQKLMNSELGSVFFKCKLKPIGGLKSVTPYQVTVQPLKIPMGIDLGA